MLLQVVVVVVVVVAVAEEEASEGHGGATERFFLPFEGKKTCCFPLSLQIFFFFSSLLSPSPRAEPLRSLARSSPHTRRHVPRVRSKERAARAGRDGDGSGSGGAGKRAAFFFPPWNFLLLAACFSLCSARLRQRDSLALWPLANEDKRPFTPAGLLLCGPLRAPRGRKEAEKASLARKSTSWKKHARAFFIARPCRIFSSFFDLSSLLFLSFLSLSTALLCHLLPAPPRAASHKLSKGERERECLESFQLTKTLLFSFQLDGKKKQNRHRPLPPPPPPPLAAPSRPRRPASPRSAPSPRGALPPGRRRQT